MMLKPNFWDYLVFFPYEDELNYDGIHDGGIKGIKEDAPDWAKKAYEEYLKGQSRLKEKNIKT